MTELTDLQALAVAEASRKLFESVTKTRTPGNLREQEDDRLHEDWERDGTDRRRIYIGGRLVGTLSARIKAADVHDEAVITDYDAAIDWLAADSDGRNIFMSWLCSPSSKSLTDRVLRYMKAEGVKPDGFEMRPVPEPARWDGTVLTGCKPKDVAQALGDALPQAMASVAALPDREEIDNG